IEIAYGGATRIQDGGRLFAKSKALLASCGFPHLDESTVAEKGDQAVVARKCDSCEIRTMIGLRLDPQVAKVLARGNCEQSKNWPFIAERVELAPRREEC